MPLAIHHNTTGVLIVVASVGFGVALLCSCTPAARAQRKKEQEERAKKRAQRQAKNASHAVVGFAYVAAPQQNPVATVPVGKGRRRFCGNCAAPGTGAAFCSNCGQGM